MSVLTAVRRASTTRGLLARRGDAAAAGLRADPSAAGTVGRPALVPVHPEATDDDAVVRWVVPAGALPFTGPVREAPGALGRLLEHGTLVSITAERDAVLVRAPHAGMWRALGGTVRSALQDALTDVPGWVPAEPAPAGESLAQALDAVLTGPTGAFIASHGGRVEVVRVADGCVDVRLGGACTHCPASTFTLRHRLEADLRARHPALVELRAVGRQASNGLR